jgi:hypothetical protein
MQNFIKPPGSRGSPGTHFALGEIDNDHLFTISDHRGYSTGTGKFGIIRMSSENEDVGKQFKVSN